MGLAAARPIPRDHEGRLSTGRETALDPLTDRGHDVRVLDSVVRAQEGMISRAQALAGGMTKAAIESKLASGRWQRVFTGVYATFSGPVPRHARLWAAVLRAGPGAVLSHETAAELIGLTDRPSTRIHVSVPTSRTPIRQPGVVIHRSCRALASRHRTRLPPQTRVEDTVIDLTQTARSLEDAIAWLARAVGSRLTTADRLSTAIGRRPRLRWRRHLCAALHDVADGCHSLTELLYLRQVERQHGLPRGRRQAREVNGGAATYADVEYADFAARVELDGMAAHPDHERWRDMRRDNASVVAGLRPLRYGISDITEYSCQVAAQVAEALHLGGWTGTPHGCDRAGCPLA